MNLLSSTPPPTGPFAPDYDDVCRVRAVLRESKLPMELVLIILDYAHYWPSFNYKTDTDDRSNGEARFTATAGLGDRAAARFCLEAAIFDNRVVDAIRTGNERPKIKAVEFNIKSRDQGWTSEGTTGTFMTSSWLEVSILSSEPDRSPRPVDLYSNPQSYHSMTGRGWSLVKRPDSAMRYPQDGEDDRAWYLQGNRVASGLENYRVLWAEDQSEGNDGAGKGEGFLQALREGDRIVVWARAKWGGWKCIVASINITIYYGF